MTRRVIRFPMADALQTALVAATELDRDELEQLQEHVQALLAALPPPLASVVEVAREDAPFLAGLPHGARGGGFIEWKWQQQGPKVYGPYPYLRVRVGGRQRSIYLRGLAQATREAARSGGPVSPSA
jgi:hypothetical protein